VYRELKTTGTSVWEKLESFAHWSVYLQLFYCISLTIKKKALNIIYFHRITESQNGRGWKGPLWVI